MKNERMLTIKVAATFIGTIVGAGFASGQEIFQFFSLYKLDGMIGILIAGILFAVLGNIILSISHHIKKDSYHEFLNYVCGRKLGLVADLFITLFLFGTLNVMLSATGALFLEYFGLPYYFGIIFTIIISSFIVLRGIKGIIDTNAVIAPTMMTVIIIISFLCISYHGTKDIIRNIYYEDDPTYKWLMSALLYVAYNIILAIPILVPLGKEIRNKEVLTNGVLLGAIVMTGLIFIINLDLIIHIDEVAKYQIPMLYIVQPFSMPLKYFFVVGLWLEIFTTIISNMIGLCNRLQSIVHIDHLKIIAVLSVVCTLVSRLNFKTLLTTLYPIFGFLSLIFIVLLLLKQIYIKINRLNTEDSNHSHLTEEMKQQTKPKSIYTH